MRRSTLVDRPEWRLASLQSGQRLLKPAHVNDGIYAQLLALQRVAGNRATTDLIQSTFVQRKCMPKIEPLPVGRLDLRRASFAMDPKNKKRIAALASKLKEPGDKFVTDWFGAVLLGLWAVEEPQNPSDELGFYVALGANLLWAVTGVSPYLVPLAIAAAYAGSTAGRPASRAAIAKQKKQLVDSLSETKDSMSNHVTDVVEEAAIDSLYERLDSDEEREQRLWRVMFPDYPWEGRTGHIARETSERVECIMIKTIDPDGAKGLLLED